MIIRDFKPEDEEIVIGLGSAMHQESDFKTMDYSYYKCQKLFQKCLNYPNHYFSKVAEIDGQPIGVFVGYKTEYFFGTDLLAHDLILFVLPKFRGTTAAIRLIRSFELWAKEQGCVEVCIGQSTGLDTDKFKHFLEKLNYTNKGNTMKKDMK